MDDLDSVSREISREYVATLDVLRHAKNVFFWLAIVAVGLHVVLWFTLRGGDSTHAARQWDLTVEWALAMAGFVGRVSVLIVAGVFTLALLISLTARLGGAASLAKACIWSLAALAMLVPWVRITPDDVAGVSSAFYEFEELNRGTGDTFFAFVRFCLCPLLVAAFLVAAQYCYRSAHRKMTLHPAAKLPIHEV